MRTPEEDAECRRIDDEFMALRVKVCAQVESAASAGWPVVSLSVSDVRQLLHVLSICDHRAKTMEEATADLRARLSMDRGIEAGPISRLPDVDL